MGGSTAKLLASLSLDVSGFKRGAASALKDLGKMETTFGRIGVRAKAGLATAATNLARLGAVGAGFAAGVIAASVKAASDLNENINKTQVVFRDASKSVLAFSDTTSQALGLSKSDALEAAGAFGNMLNTVGLAPAASAKMSTALVTLAADMASFNNEDPTEMLDKLRSGLSGEAEPLRRFGVLLSESAVKNEATRIGLAKSNKQLTEAQKVQARYSLILQQTKVQQGDFARTSDGLANQQRILKASLADTAATVGTALLPRIATLALKLNKFIKDNQPAIREFADKLPGAFDKLLAAVERIPWGVIGEGLKTGAFFAGKLVDAFLAMPTEVQSTIIALAGLNKLSGGAVSGIVGELGKGLIKGVLGMNAGVVNINAAVVNGGGGLPGIGGGAAGAAGAAGGILAAGPLVAALGVALPIALLNVLPEVFRGAPGSGAVPLQTRPGRLDQTSVGMFSGMMPSFRALADQNGAVPVAVKNRIDLGTEDRASLQEEKRIGRLNLDTLMDARTEIAAQRKQGLLQTASLTTLDHTTASVKAATSLVAAKQEETRRAIKAIPAPVQTTNVRVDVKTYVSSRDITYKQNKAASVVTGHAVNRGALAADL